MVFAYLEHAIGTKRHTHLLEPGYTVSDSEVRKVLDGFVRMASGEPLQYVCGKAHFYGREFCVTPATLIPRPETELLCREAVRLVTDKGISSPRILDLCTGSGCIAWTLSLEMPGADVTAADISQEALGVAASQDFTNEMSVSGALPPDFVLSDILSPPTGFNEEYDLIVSNPPYVMDSEKALMRRNVLEHEPHLALFVPDEDPLVFYRSVASWASALLTPGGSGIVEINEALGMETAAVFSSEGFCDVRVLKDLSEKDRFVIFSKK